jgi:hypothetical protein
VSGIGPSDAASADETPADGSTSQPSASALPALLVRTSADISLVLDTLHRSRTLLERVAAPRLQDTREVLAGISSTTATAAHGLLDGLSRSLALIDGLAQGLRGQTGPDSELGRAAESELRDEVHRLIACVQFQDIVAQNIAHAIQVLRDAEQRMVAASQYFDIAFVGHRAGRAADIPQPDADAATSPAPIPDGQGQAAADAIFAGIRASTPAALPPGPGR